MNNQGSEAECNFGDGENSLQTSDVCIDNDGDLLHGESCAYLSGADGQGEAWVELWQILGEVIDELVVEATLGGGDGDLREPPTVRQAVMGCC